MASKWSASGDSKGLSTDGAGLPRLADLTGEVQRAHGAVARPLQVITTRLHAQLPTIHPNTSALQQMPAAVQAARIAAENTKAWDPHKDPKVEVRARVCQGWRGLGIACCPWG